jgi:hypothetical protein
MPHGGDAQHLEVAIAEINDMVEIEIVFDIPLDPISGRVLRQPFGDINPGRAHSAMSTV